MTLSFRYLLKTSLTNEKFYVRGVVYQLSHHLGDPICDERLEGLAQDVALFKELGINTIYVCMRAQASLWPKSADIMEIVSIMQKHTSKL